MLEQPTPLHIKALKILIAAGIVVALCAAGGCGGELPESSCGPSPQPASQPDAGLPMCGGFPGYSLTFNDCGGRQADGLRCVRDCTWRLGSDPSAEIADAGTITVDPGCTTPGADGGNVLCVFDCLACH